MNVKELIEALSKCNPEAIVVCHDSDEGTIEIGFDLEGSMAKHDGRFYFNHYDREVKEVPVVVLS